MLEDERNPWPLQSFDDCESDDYEDEEYELSDEEDAILETSMYESTNVTIKRKCELAIVRIGGDGQRVSLQGNLSRFVWMGNNTSDSFGYWE